MLNELERIRAKFLQKNIHKAIEAVDRVFTIFLVILYR